MRREGAVVMALPKRSESSSWNRVARAADVSTITSATLARHTESRHVPRRRAVDGGRAAVPSFTPDAPLWRGASLLVV